MSLNVDDDDHKPTAHFPSIPLDLNGNEITWDQNFANALGRISRLMDAFERDGTFPLLFSHRAAYHGGRIYVESAETVNFITGKSVDTQSYDYRNVCPPTPMRNTTFTATRTAANAAGNVLQVTAMGAELATTIPADLSKTYFISPAAVAKDKAALLKILAGIFKGTPWCTKHIKEAKGDGLIYLEKLKEKAGKADINDKTAVIAKFDKVRTDLISGALNEVSLSDFLTRYEAAKLDAEQAVSDATEAQMITTIALSDPEIGRDYYTLALSSEPTDLDSAVDLIDKVLRGKARHTEIIEARHGALVTEKKEALKAAPEAEAPADPTARALEALAVAIKELKDPRKTRKDRKEKEKFSKTLKTTDGTVIPRDKDDRVVKWIEGMAKCKHCGGKHLHRDCPEREGTEGAKKDSSQYSSSPASEDGSQPILPPGLDLRSADSGSPTTTSVTSPISDISEQPAAACNAALAALPIEPPPTAPPVELLPDVRLPPPALPRTTLLAADEAFSTRSGNALAAGTDNTVLPSTPLQENHLPLDNGQSESEEPTATASPKRGEARSRRKAKAEKRRAGTTTANTAVTSDFDPSLLELPYHGQWRRTRNERKRGAAARARTARLLGDVGTVGIDDLLRSALAAETRLSAESSDDSLHVAHPDSGCSGSCTNKKENLVNVRPCHETYVSASGETATASLIGDLPVRAIDRQGRKVRFVLRNVRWVPSFHYTLLSVMQLWAEQQIDVRFADVNALVLPQVAGGHEIPFSPKQKLPTVALESDAPKPKAPSAPTHAAFSGLGCACGKDGCAGDAPGSDALLCSGCDDDDGTDGSTDDATEPLAALLAAIGLSEADLLALLGEAVDSGGPAGGSRDLQPAEAAPSRSGAPLGWHRVGATSHVGKLHAVQASELLHRRSHLGVGKLRATYHTTHDAPKVLSHAVNCSCAACAAARIKRAPHSGTLAAPAAEPGKLHVDLKELVLSIGNFRYAVFAIDEYTRYVFVEFIKTKDEAGEAVNRIKAAFNALVGAPVDGEGRALPRPHVRHVHSDWEGKLVSKQFRAFSANDDTHLSLSPPHDHDLNPIAERIIGAISETMTAVRLATEASPRLWPWLLQYVVDWHNSTIGSVGSSSTDETISPYQRFTLRKPRVMDLAAFGARAVVLKPPSEQHKPSLSGRGWQGSFLGRTRGTPGCYDVLVDGNRIVRSSSVLVDEERFDWAPKEKKHQPLTPVARAPSQPQHAPLLPDGSAGAGDPPTPLSQQHLLSLFSGPYGRADGLAPLLYSLGWGKVTQVDNDGEKGGGWQHDLLNDSKYSELLAAASSGAFHAVMVAHPCSPYTISRFFDASNSGEGDPGPPILFTKEYPDGLPESMVDPEHHRELRNAKELLARTRAIVVAAHRSPTHATIVFENPADRSIVGSNQYGEEFSNHGAIFGTSLFKSMAADAELTQSATFAYCMLGASHQKYTTLYYTADAAAVLDALKSPTYQCNHPRGWHTRIGGRGADGKFHSHRAAAYPPALIDFLARAFTLARTGSAAPQPQQPPPAQLPQQPQQPRTPASAPADGEAWWQGMPTPPLAGSSAGGVTPHAGGVPASAAAAPPSPPSPSPSPSTSFQSPIAFPSLGRGSFGSSSSFTDDGGLPTSGFPTVSDAGSSPLQPQPQRPQRNVRPGVLAAREQRELQQAEQHAIESMIRRRHNLNDPKMPVPPEHQAKHRKMIARGQLEPVSEADETLATMEAAVASALFASTVDDDVSTDLTPISAWLPLPTGNRSQRRAAHSALFGKRLPGGERAVSVHVDLNGDELTPALLLELNAALRADSPDAPSTHAEAISRGVVWVKAEKKELDNHTDNASWVDIPRSEVPRGRRLHKLIWVYKVKRDGTAKARLCVQGTTLESGIDYDQVWSSALRYSSARAIFAYAARHGCRVRSVDLVAAYLQGQFLEGEVVYCHQPVGHVKLDKHGVPMVAKVQKPIYGIQQAGRRLQRMLFDWLVAPEQGFRQLDDSDPCVFVRECDDGERLVVGCYVDNLQIAHSVELDDNGRGPAGCAYNAFMDALNREWKVVDEGPMEDLLGIEVDYLEDGSIKLHQKRYIEKIVARFLPNGATPKVQRGSLPFSTEFLQNVNEALSQTEPLHPELTRDFQERVGCLMYAATSTRPDIAYVVSQLCRCLQKPTPALLVECDHVLSYLSRHASVGLTYSKGAEGLEGFADASWETRFSTSGWVVLWQSAALSWGSRKQKSIALSSCEAEIIALSEAAKDVVYLRKLVSGLGDAESEPTRLRTDSQSARDVSYNPEHHDRMKHVERRHFYVRDMVEKFELEVPFVRTADNLADFFTKPLDGKKFHAMRRLIMNEAGDAEAAKIRAYLASAS